MTKKETILIKVDHVTKSNAFNGTDLIEFNREETIQGTMLTKPNWKGYFKLVLKQEISGKIYLGKNVTLNPEDIIFSNNCYIIN